MAASMETLDELETENSKLKEEILKKTEEIVQLKKDKSEMLGKLTGIEDWFSERLVQVNKEWTKNCEESKKNREKNKKVIGELKKKAQGLKETNEDQKTVIEALKSKIAASSNEIVALKNSKAEMENKMNGFLKNEFDELKMKHEKALKEIAKLAKYLNLYGKLTRIC